MSPRPGGRSAVPSPRRQRGGGLAALLVAATLHLGACSDLLTVENPQDVLDSDLDTERAVGAVLNGLIGDHAWAYTHVVYMSSQLADEMVHTGSDPGIRRPSDGDARSIQTWAAMTYNRSVRAAFTADDAVRRFRSVLSDPDAHPAVARARVQGGFAYLLLADNMCAVTFDGGAPVDPADVYPMAVAHFTEALEVATAAAREDIQLRALAGRARARLATGDWAGARNDARQIPHGFVFWAVYSENSEGEHNLIAQQTRRTFRKETGVRPTFYEDPRYQADPRVPFTDRGPAEVGVDGISQFVEQDKYPSRASDMRLASWQEARLIEAEAELELGNLAGAVELIDEVREAAGLAPYGGPLTHEAVFDQLIYERSAELFLEGQRLRDLRLTSDPFTQGRDTCFPISIQERSSNPNVP